MLVDERVEWHPGRSVSVASASLSLSRRRFLIVSVLRALQSPNAFVTAIDRGSTIIWEARMLPFFIVSAAARHM